MIVEVDANLTADNIAVALHDDYFFNSESPLDYTCINQLTLEELKEIMPEVSSLKQILKASKRYSVMTESDRPSGQVVVEIKTPAPICVPLAEEQDALQDLVDAVLDDIRSARMEDQVTIESFSPEILMKVAAEEGNIPRMLALDAGQLLPLEEIPNYTEYDVRIIEKDSFGLTWGEVGIEIPPDLFMGFYRWPGYHTGVPGEELGNYIRVLGETGSSIASLDKIILLSQLPEVAQFIVGTLHGAGYSVLSFTIEHGQELLWVPVADSGVDGIYIDNIPAGLDMEVP
jgi:glycerophosphoryl diester phosphodiesterase